jgi:hypothetical protein
MISALPSRPSITWRSRRWSSGSVSRSSRTGITIEYSGATVADSTVLDASAPGRVDAPGDSRTWLATHAVDIAFGLVVLATAAYFLRVTRESWFFADEWAMADQVRRTQDIADPYNGHLSVTILSLYRVLLELFGFTTHLPYRIAGIISLIAVPVAMYLVARRRVGAPAAAAMGLILLWFRGISLEPGGLNHSLSLLGAIVCGWALAGRGRRRDAVVAASLAFALASSGGGVAVAVAAVVHSLCSRATRWRWLAVLLPSAAWLTWWTVFVPPDSEEVQRLRPGVLDLAEDAVRNAAESFRFLALGNRVAGGILLALFIVHAVWRVRQGLGAAANVLAWTAALLFWWFGLFWSRWLLIGDPPAFRYEWVSAGFIFLAVLPPRPVTLPSWAAASTRKGSIVATAGVLLMAAALVHSVRPDVREFADFSSATGRLTRGQAAVVLDPRAALPDGTQLGFSFANMGVGRFRGVLNAYGMSDGRASTDQRLVDVGAVRLVVGPRAQVPARCRDLARPMRVGTEAQIEVYAPSQASDVRIRRFGTDWITAGRVPEGRQAKIGLPGFHATDEWELSATGRGCASEVAR